MRNNLRPSFIDSLGVLLIGSFCLGYSVFYRHFAEANVSLGNLGFPIFVGEILLLLCALLLFIRDLLGQVKVGRLGYLLIAFLLFVFLKAIIGNAKFGPLAFRHAALFYYSVFAVFGYYFFSKDFFSGRLALFLTAVVILISKFLPPYDYFLFAYLVITVILIRAQSSKIRKYALYFLLLLFFPFKYLTCISRMMLVGNAVGVLFIASLLISRLKAKRNFKLIFAGLALLAIPIVFFKITDPNAAASMVNFNKIISLYQEYDKIITDKSASFKMGDYRPQLYHSELSAQSDLLFKMIKYSDPRDKNESGKPILPATLVKVQINQAYASSTGPQRRNLENAYTNTLFRIFIWRDAFRQIVSKPFIFGFDFGKPFRSKSLEILGWGQVEWQRDGWISIHSSYLDMIYRAGIVGIGLIIAFLAILYSMLKKIFSTGSLTGMLVFAVVISWAIAGNFLDILELPHTAIVFWSLFGMLYAYLFKPIKPDTLR